MNKLWDPWEAEAWKPPPEMTIDKWAEDNVHLPQVMAERHGPLNLDLTPYLREPLRAYTDNQTQEITICASAQVGKTTMLIIPALYYMAENPSPVMIVMPNESDAKSINTERFQRVINASPNLSKFLTEKKKDMNDRRILLNGTQINFAWATSPAALASRPVCILQMDELDKWLTWSGKEANPVKLARERTKTYSRRKIGKTSTPLFETGYIWKEYLAGTREKYFVPCPHCDHYQELIMGSSEPKTPGLKWPKDVSDPNKIIDHNLAWYECEKCHGEIRDKHKPNMLLKGVWKPEKISIEDAKNGNWRGLSKRLRSFHIWTAYSLFTKFSEIVAEFMNSKDDPQNLMNFVNSWQGLPWKVSKNTMKSGMIKEREKPYKRGKLPKSVEMLLASIDVQEDHYWYVIRGWGVGEKSWLIRAGSAHSWEELDRILFKTVYLSEDGNKKLKVEKTFIDSGYRTSEVYEWAMKRYPRCIAIKGGGPFSRPRSISKPKEGVMLITLNPNYWKDKLYRFITTQDGDEGEWSVHEKIDLSYCQQMTSEHRVFKKKGTGKIAVWEPVSEKVANHYWDCEYYNVALADMAGVEFLGQEEEVEEIKEEPRGDSLADENWLDDEGFIGSEEEWL